MREFVRPVLQARQLKKSLGRRFVVGPVDLSLYPGHLLLVTGPTGSGKSVLMQTFAALLQPDEGELLICGTPSNVEDVRRHVGYLTSDAEAHSELAVRKYLQFCAIPWNPDPHYLPFLVQKALARVRVADATHDPVSQLGVHLKRRLALARAIIHDPELVLLDDPVRVPNEPERNIMVEIVQSLRAAGKTVVVASQHVELYRPIATHGLFLAGGTVYACTELRGSQPASMRIRRVELFLGAEEQAKAVKFIRTLEGVLFAESSPEDLCIQIIVEGDATDVTKLISWISDHGFPVVTFQERAGAF
jgi:ABC-type multidrug transport system ATPase subunit